MNQAYFRVFERLGIGADTKIALASGGDFTPDFSHEFQTICDAGEDTLFWAKSADIVYNREVAPSKAPKWSNANEPLEAKQDVEGQGIIGVKQLAKFLNIPVEKTTKTMLYETDNGEVVAVAVRGNYQIHEEKVCKIVGCARIKLASAETVKRITGAEVGYAGPLNLPTDVTVLWDESTKGRRNFECGANKTHFHSINVNFDRDLPEPKKFYDVKVAEVGDLYPKTNEVYEVVRACEVGNIFPLNTKFSKAFDFSYVAEDGSARPVYMGCYGIGSSRLMGVITEKYADDKGLVWPKQIAPYTVHLIDITMPERGQEMYEALRSMGIDVLWDDRDLRAGEKFADADLLGIPVRLVVSAKTAERIEWKERGSQTPELISLGEVINRAVELQKNI
jgi:prolyl-tRNA synthetase